MSRQPLLRRALGLLIFAAGCATAPTVREPTDPVEPLLRAGRKVENAIAATRLLIERARSADYVPDLYMRLAELHVEQARYAWLVQYERARARGESSRAVDVPAARLLKNLAIGIYETVLREFPAYEKCDEAMFLMAHEYRELGEFAPMKQTYEKLIQQYPKSPHRLEAYLILGDSAFDGGDLERAERAYNSVLAAPTSRVHPLARYKLAWVRINREDCKGAVALFEKILRDKSTPRGTSALVATQRSLDLHREALVDLAYCYPDVYPENPVGPFMRSLAESSSDYMAAMRRVAKRFAIKQLYAQGANALREVLGAASSDEEALDDARRLYDNVIKARVFDQAAVDVERIGRVFERRYYDYRLPKAERDQLAVEFELYARDLATRTQLAAKERRSPTLHAAAAAAYGAYLDYFGRAKAGVEMEQNRAESLTEAEQPFAAGRAYERTAALLTEAEPRRQARLNAVSSYQRAQERGTLSRTERLIAWGGIRAQGRALIADHPGDESIIKVKLGIARTYYDAGDYATASDLFVAVARQYPTTTEGVAAANLALDSMRLAGDYDRLATIGRRLLGDARLGDAKLKQDITDIVAKAEQRQVAELTIASSDDKQERLLSYAKRYQGSGLGEQALYNALLVARTDGNIDRFYALGEEFIDQYPRSAKRTDVMLALAGAASDRGDFAQAARYLEATYAADPRGREALPRLLTAASIRAVLGEAKVVDDVKELSARGAPRAEIDEVLLQAAGAGGLTAVEELVRGPQLQGAVADFLRGYFAWQRGDKDEAAQRLQQSAAARAEGGSLAADATGRARFLLGELVYEAYLGAGQGEVTAALAEKSQLLQATDAAYAQAAQGQRARWAVAALARVADAYTKFAAFLRGLKAPDDVPAAEKEQLQQAFAAKADEATTHAGELRSACARRARERQVFSELGRACLEGSAIPERVALLPVPATRRGADPAGAAELRAALLKSPRNADLLMKLASLYVGAGDLGTALLVIDRAESFDGKRADVHNLRGVTLERIGDPDTAFAEFKRAVELDERSLPARLNLAAHYAAYGYLAEAQAELKRSGGAAPARGAPDEHPKLGLLDRLGAAKP